MRAVWSLLVAAMAFVAVTSFARASAAAPRVVLSSASGAPVVLAPRDGGLAGDFTITNVGDAPLVVSRIAIRGDADDVRSPPHVTVRFESGAPTSATLAPGEERVATVRWMPDRTPRMTQALGHVVVTSTDEAAGEVAIGFRGELSPPLSTHVLSLVVAVPLLGALVALSLGDPRRARVAAIVVGVLECGLVAWVLHRFVPGVTIADGNDGLQLVEHAVWIRALGVEWFVGVDGANIGAVSLVALLALAGATSSGPTRSPAYHAGYLVLVAALVGAALALDAFLLFAFVEAAVVAAFVLVQAWGEGRERELAATKLAVAAWIASALLLFGVVALVAHGDRTFLVDGTSVRHTSSIPDLARVSFVSKRATLFGLPLVKVAWSAIFGAVALLLPAFPLHVAHVAARVSAPAPVSALLAGALPAVVATVAVRLLVEVLPEGARWAQGTLVGAGALTIAYGAACAWAERDVRRAVAFGATSQSGYVLLGLGALSPQGITGALVQAVAAGLAAGLVVLAIAALEERAPGEPLEGAARGAPSATAFVGLAALAAFGAPLTAPFWGELVVTLGAFASFHALAIVAALARVVLALFALSLLRTIALRPSPSARRVVDLGARDVACMAPVAVVVVVLGAWPAPLLAAVSGTVHDLVVHVGAGVADPLAALTP